MTTEQEQIAGMVAELERVEPIGVQFQAASAFHFVALLQLALRHPAVPPASRAVAERFIAAARDDWFANCPHVRATIDDGNDPARDR